MLRETGTAELCNLCITVPPQSHHTRPTGGGIFGAHLFRIWPPANQSPPNNSSGNCVRAMPQSGSNPTKKTIRAPGRHWRELKLHSLRAVDSNLGISAERFSPFPVKKGLDQSLQGSAIFPSLPNHEELPGCPAVSERYDGNSR
jgi:hypothetical protein